MKYKLLAIDVDGTLIGPDQRVAPEVVDAIADAEAAGLRVCLATGRSYVETMPAWRQLELAGPYEPMVLIGGAMVSEPDTARTLYHKPMDRELAFAFADALDEFGFSAMAFVDGWRCGVDYYFSTSADRAQAVAGWFDKMDVVVRRVRRLRDAADMPAPLRVSAVADPERAAELARELTGRFDGQLNIHPILAPNYGVTIVEAFAAGASKLEAVRYVAQSHRLGPGAIAAVGDDVNDLAMIRGAGLGVAMPDSAEAVREAADHYAADGLAAFIRRLIDGEFDDAS